MSDLDKTGLLLSKADADNIEKIFMERLAEIDLTDMDQLEKNLFEAIKREMLLFCNKRHIDLEQLEELDFDELKESFILIAQKAFHRCRDTVLEGTLSLSKQEIDSIERQVKNQFHKAFWDLLVEDLKVDPPETGHIITLLEEVKTRINNLTPNNKRLHQTMDEEIDLDYLSRLIKGGHRVFDLEFLMGIVEFIFQDRLKVLSSVEDEERVERCYRELRQLADKSPLYYEIVPEIFKRIYYWIETIEEGIKAFKKNKMI